MSTQMETSIVVHMETGTRNGLEAQGRGKRPRGSRVTESLGSGWSETAVWEARCPHPLVQGTLWAPQTLSQTSFVKLTAILPALGGNGPSRRAVCFS